MWKLFFSNSQFFAGYCNMLLYYTFNVIINIFDLFSYCNSIFYYFVKILFFLTFLDKNLAVWWDLLSYSLLRKTNLDRSHYILNFYRLTNLSNKNLYFSKNLDVKMNIRNEFGILFKSIFK